jgi:hypothetical protein
MPGRDDDAGLTQARIPMHQPGPLPPLALDDGPDASPALTAAALVRQLTRHGITGICTATTAKCAVISITADLTAWTDGHLVWCIHRGQRRTWPAAHAEAAAACLAVLAAAGS